MSVVLPAEGDAIVVEGDETMVGDGNAVSVASQVVEDMFCPAERRLGVDDPVLTEELMEETAEAIRLSEALSEPWNWSLSWSKSSSSPSANLPRKTRLSTRTGRKKRGEEAIHPERSLGQAAGRNDAVDMGMMLQVLSPGVEHAE